MSDTEPTAEKRLTMAKINLALATRGDQREEVKLFAMSPEQFDELVGDSKDNCVFTWIGFKNARVYYEVVQAFGREVLVCEPEALMVLFPDAPELRRPKPLKPGEES